MAGPGILLSNTFYQSVWLALSLFYRGEWNAEFVLSFERLRVALFKFYDHHCKFHKLASTVIQFFVLLIMIFIMTSLK